MRSGRTAFLGILATCVMAGPVRAQGPALRGASTPAGLSSASLSSLPPDSVYLNPFEIMVTAARLQVPLRQNPAATTLIGREELRTMPRTVGAEEALRLVPGVRVDNQADGSRVHLSIRGQGILTERGIRGIKVLLDGLPLNDPTGVAPDLYDVDWALVDRCEVLRGPSAALYGGGGSGGVVNLTTVQGGPEPLRGEVSTTFGSYGFQKTVAQAGGTRGPANYRVAFSRALGAGYRDHTCFSADNASMKNVWTPSPTIRLTQTLGWTDYFDANAEGLNLAQVRENPRQANPDAGLYNEFYRTRRFSSGVVGQMSLTPAHEIQCSGYFRVTKFTESVPSSIRHRTLLSPGLTAQYSYHANLARLKNHLSLGSDLQWQSIDEYRVKNLQAAREGALLSNQTIGQYGMGFFLLDRVELGASWGIMLSGRYDKIENRLTDLFPETDCSCDLSGRADFNKATGRIGLAYAPGPRLNLYTNYGQGFLPPATEELANNPERLGGFNPNLSPATSRGEEVGARGSLGGVLTYDLAVFHLATKNDFNRYRMPARPLETFYRNLGSSRRYGLEALLRCHPLSCLSAEMAYTLSDFRYATPDSIRDNRLPNSPEHQLTLDLSGHPWDNLTLGVSCEVQTRWAIDAENSAWVGGFTLWGARAAWAWRIAGIQGDLTLAGRNLFAREWIAFSEPDPDGNSYQPGPKGEIFGGVRIRI